MSFNTHDFTLNAITLENFQAIKERTKIPISPLTFLYGPNSSGKSAIYDALTLIKKVLSGECYSHLFEHWRYIKANDNASRCMLFIIEGYIERDASISAEGAGFIEDDTIFNTRMVLDFDYTIARYMENKNQQAGEILNLLPISIEIRESEIYVGDLITLYLDGKCVFRSTRSENNDYTNIEVSVDFFGNNLKNYLDHLDLDIDAPSNYSINVRNSNFLQVEFTEDQIQGASNLESAKFLLEIVNYYLNLFRYLKLSPTLVHSDRGTIRNDGLAWMDHAIGSRLNTHPTIAELASNENKASWVNHCLADHLFLELDQCYQITYKRDGLLVECGLVDKTGRVTSFEDVGTGISCLVPVLAALHDVFSFIQQPELHLHPALQAALGDVCIEAIRNSASFSIKHIHPWLLRDRIETKRVTARHIIESHSEHLLLRVLKRIRQTHLQINIAPELKIEADDVCVLYFNPLPDGTTSVKRLRITEDGEFMDRWPRGFFAERDQELLDE